MGQAKNRGTRDERIAAAKKKAEDELNAATLAAVNKVAEEKGEPLVEPERIAALSTARKERILTGARRSQFRMGGLGLAAASVLAVAATQDLKK